MAICFLKICIWACLNSLMTHISNMSHVNNKNFLPPEFTPGLTKAWNINLKLFFCLRGNLSQVILLWFQTIPISVSQLVIHFCHFVITISHFFIDKFPLFLTASGKISAIIFHLRIREKEEKQRGIHHVNLKSNLKDADNVSKCYKHPKRDDEYFCILTPSPHVHFLIKERTKWEPSVTTTLEYLAENAQEIIFQFLCFEVRLMSIRGETIINESSC